jgi:hypothetical protein
VRSKMIRFIVFLLFAITWVGSDAIAQVTTAAINGSLRDTTGAAVEGGAVTVQNDDTGYRRTVQSGADGSFQAPLLPLGPYTVTAEKTGFSRYVQRGVRLELNQSARLDITLTVGNVHETSRFRLRLPSSIRPAAAPASW